MAFIPHALPLSRRAPSHATTTCSAQPPLSRRALIFSAAAAALAVPAAAGAFGMPSMPSLPQLTAPSIPSMPSMPESKNVAPGVEQLEGDAADRADDLAAKMERRAQAKKQAAQEALKN